MRPKMISSMVEKKLPTTLPVIWVMKLSPQ